MSERMHPNMQQDQDWQITCQFCGEWLPEHEDVWTWRVYEGVIAHDVCYRNQPESVQCALCGSDFTPTDTTPTDAPLCPACQDDPAVGIPEDVRAMVPSPREVEEVSFHLGGAPSILRVGDRFHNDSGEYVSVTTISLVPEHMAPTPVRIRIDDANHRVRHETTDAGTILDHVYEGRWKRIGKALAGAALLALTLLPSPADAREDATQGFLTPPANCELYLAFEDHSSLAYCADGHFIAFDPGTPDTQGRGWSMTSYTYSTKR